MLSAGYCGLGSPLPMGWDPWRLTQEVDWVEVGEPRKASPLGVGLLRLLSAW